jgi:penicillin-binding protein 1C
MRLSPFLSRWCRRFAGYVRRMPRRTRVRWVVALALLAWFWCCLPRPLFRSPTCFVLTSASGELLNAAIAADGQWRFPYNPEVPDKFARCIVAFEDKRFYYHPGVDPLAAARALWRNIARRRTVSGGSTLTMQVMRLSSGHASRSFWNKLSESFMALRLECTHRKATILALYASNAPFGSNVVGLDAAAWRYYGRRPAELSWGEMAALAVLPNAPALVHPGKNRDALLRKRNALLDRLAATGDLDAATAALAKQEALPGEPRPLPQLAPHLLDQFRKEYRQARSDAPTRVQTTLNSTLQREVAALLQQHQAVLQANSIRHAAALVVEVETGNILSYIGNTGSPADTEGQAQVDVLRAPRSPGSTLKPLLYAAMLSDGQLLPRQLIPDIPTQLGSYAPQNFNLEYDGAVPAHRALARSLNIPAVRLLQQYRYNRFYDLLHQCGFTTLRRPADHYGMSLILGGCEVTPFELAGVYSSLARLYVHQRANKGQWNPNDWFMPRYTTGPPATRPDLPELFDYPALWHTFNAMNEVMRPGEEGLWGLFGSAQKIAWKTGTSFGFRDGWAIGLTPKYCVVVWVGNATGEGRAGLTGINTAAPILFDIFRALPASPWFESPAGGFRYLPVCRQSGFRAGPDCAAADTILVGEKAQLAGNCPYCRIVHLDHTGTYRVNESCEAPSAMQHRPWFVLPPTMEYYYRKTHAGYQVLPPYLPGCTTGQQQPIDIIYPEEGARIYVPRELTGERGRTVFTATHRYAGATLYWHLDDHFLAKTNRFHQVAIDPVPGPHTLTVVDEQGESVSRRFVIVNEK